MAGAPIPWPRATCRCNLIRSAGEVGDLTGISICPPSAVLAPSQDPEAGSHGRRYFWGTACRNTVLGMLRPSESRGLIGPEKCDDSPADNAVREVEAVKKGLRRRAAVRRYARFHEFYCQDGVPLRNSKNFLVSGPYHR